MVTHLKAVLTYSNNTSWFYNIKIDINELLSSTVGKLIIQSIAAPPTDVGLSFW